MHIVTKKTEGTIINKICQLENCNKYDHNDFIRPNYRALVAGGAEGGFSPPKFEGSKKRKINS